MSLLKPPPFNLKKFLLNLSPYLILFIGFPLLAKLDSGLTIIAVLVSLFVVFCLVLQIQEEGLKKILRYIGMCILVLGVPVGISTYFLMLFSFDSKHPDFYFWLIAIPYWVVLFKIHKYLQNKKINKDPSMQSSTDSLVIEQKKKILLIDNDLFLTSMYALKLKKRGAEVTVFNDTAGDIVQRVLEVKPDLISLNVVIHDSSGFAVAKMLRADERTRNIPFVFLTLQSRNSDIGMGRKLGARAYIKKTYNDPAGIIEILLFCCKTDYPERFKVF